MIYELGDIYKTASELMVEVDETRPNGYAILKILKYDRFQGARRVLYNPDGYIPGGSEDGKLVKKLTKEENPEYFL